MSKEKKQSKMSKNYNPSEWVAIGYSNKKPQDTKVMIWGYELCNGAEWKDFLDVVNKLDKEKTDLEAKLAESEKENKTLICDYESRITKNHELMSWLEHKNEELKQQLAEKDTKLHEYIRCALEDYNDNTKEIIELKQQLEEKDKEIEKLTEELDDKNFCKEFVDLYSENKLKTQMLHENWKDKISFAVEKLEKVKNRIQEDFDYDDLMYWLNKQIEELKKEMNDFVIEELSEYDYRVLQGNVKLMNNVLYVLYYDKRICLLCQEEYKRSSADENPNFCPTCLKQLTHQHEDKGE